MPKFRCCAVVILLILASATHGEDLTLRNNQWTVQLDPATLRMDGTPKDGKPIPLSSPLASHDVASLNHDASHAGWRYPAEKVNVSVQLEGDTVIAHFIAAEPGKFTWPVIAGDAAPVAYALPMFEGVLVPSDDEQWATFLEHEGPLDTTAGLSMPFWGVQRGDHTLTYLLTNPFNNELTFHRENGKLSASFAHEFTRNHPVKEYEVRITLAGPSPIEPAKVYRRWLTENKQLVTFTEKIARTPAAARLPGAAHVYLWGDNILCRSDFTDAAGLAKQIVAQSRPVDALLWMKLGSDGQSLLKEIADKPMPDNYDRGRLADTLTALLESPDFYDAKAWAGIDVPHELPSQIGQANAHRLYAAYSQYLSPADQWGDGFSRKMVDRLAAAGLDRLWLGSPDWKGLSEHPDFTREAIAKGYLVGPYDSYHSIHSPKETDTWETAQFNQSLYDTGAITKADGSKKKGFKQKGFNLSPIAARPYLEKRVAKLMAEFQCNSWFMDCDAFGEVFDDYSPQHPATQADDMNERLSRMAWIRDTYGAVIGSEGGSSYAAGTIHFAHGLMTPVIGWGDPDLKDRKSPYFLGRYYPPDAPEMSFKQVPMKPLYRRIYTDPQFRLPLYQVALHDSIITTHEWGEGSFKFTDPDHARELLELLYNVPPLYHLNLVEWQKRKAAIVAHYQFFSPLHREAALLPMTDWRTLTDDRLVQKTTFGDKLEMIANFGAEPFTYEGTQVPKQSALARWLDGRKSVVYSPQ